ncbi:MAG: sigma-54-dependent Fis family transcriptional regulator [Bacteroidetes bacterium]|nr:sigma-54-dependent Fis family transcriptional regulator [Bacteroidota bacterium]
MKHILIVDDEKNIRRSVEMILKEDHHEIFSAENGKEALELVQKETIHLVFLDLLMPDMNGIEVLKQIKESSPDTTVLMMSGHGTIEHAVEAVKLGAYDFIEKPLTKEKVLISARNVLERASLRAENRVLKKELARKFTMIGESPAMQDIKNQIMKVAPTQARMLILGESGTGKELAARAIHDQSPRAGKAFVKVNCAAIPEELIESELFGAVKGAYTGSVADRDGRFVQAHLGTIFLDEIGDMSLKVQAKVLRALQEGEFEKVGGNKTLKVDVRVLAATNKDLKAEVQKGLFREDLYFRLNVVPLVMPPLRARKSDIPKLVDYFVQLCCEEIGVKPKSFSSEAIKKMMEYSWPGNIREVRNVVERMMILAAGDVVQPEELPTQFSESEPAYQPNWSEHKTLKDVKEAVERSHIIRVLEKTNWNVTKAAQELDVERTNLHKKLKYYDINTEKKGDSEGN